MENQEVTHMTINGKYRFVVERSAVKGVLGYKVEVNADDYAEGVIDIGKAKRDIEKIAVEPLPTTIEVLVAKEKRND